MPETPAAVPDTARPRLAAGVRLHFDTRRQAWMLLAPERVVETEDPAHDILSRCDGSRTVQQIVDELTEIYTADRAEIADDVAGLLAELVGKRMVEL
jgi:pyrroloquinoline quinone biosynthesis protein D